jgi:hypothetical protein
MNLPSPSISSRWPQWRLGLDFTFVLDLSTISYKSAKTSGAGSQQLADHIRVWFDRWLASATPKVVIDVLLIPDRKYIDSPPDLCDSPPQLWRVPQFTRIYE